MASSFLACLLFGFVAAESRFPSHGPAAMFGIEPHIIGGDPVDITSHPYQVSLQTSGGSHTCGAAIISTNKLTCVAHCTQDAPGSYMIRAGSSDRTSGGQTTTIQSFVNHPSYSGSSAGMPNDVSVIHLASDLVFDSTVNSIDMAASGSFIGSTATITGWGRTSGSNILPTQLQGVAIPVIANTDCQGRMVGIEGGIINSGHICVFNNVNAGCNGDSGSPARVGSIMVGAMSWMVSDSGNCLTSYPSVYTRTSFFKAWIDSN